ncbi:MAG: cation-translocating P-type ATPase [Thermoplasmata archaeon]
MQEQAWHSLSIDEAWARVESSPQGLSQAEAERRLMRDGPNELLEVEAVSPLLLFAQQFTHPLVIILIVAAGIAAFLGEILDTVVIALIVVFNAVFGFIQEYRAERAMQALKRLAAPKAHVLRDEEEVTIPTRELVVGDVVLLSAGSRVPADLRLFEVANLLVNEASLTGESVAVHKGLDPVPEGAPLGDRTNLSFMGTAANVGRGRGFVVATGMATELGRIAGMVQEESVPQTPLQRQLARFAKQLGVVILAVVLFVFLVGYLRDPDAIVELFLTAVALAVAAIPEALPAVVTVGLALGLRRMARRHALIRRLPAVEALGGTTVICTDKTGTLTTGQMNIRIVAVGDREYEVVGEGFAPEGVYRLQGQRVDPADDEGLMRLLSAALLDNDARLVQEGAQWTVLGDPTEGALLVAAMRAGLRPEVLEADLPRVGEVPFTSERKRMTTIHAPVDAETLAEFRARGDETLELLGEIPGKVAWTKGAPEAVLERSAAVYSDGESVPLTEEDREGILERARSLAWQAYRVLALAYRELPDQLPDLGEETVERDLVYLGLVGMMDAPRKDAIEAVKRSKEAGIEVVMITGDHLLTAEAVAREMGILEEGEDVMTAADLDRLPVKQLAERVEHVKVYARVSPEHKVKIVSAWKRRGAVVAMTGDGVNDAPALRRSDIGIAMGITGTDVAKESSDVVLTDDNFASISVAVEEGRGVYENIRKFVRYLLSTNSGEVMILFVAAAAFLPLPLLPLQILWINLITDGFPAIALAVERKESGLMERPPRDPRTGILSGDMGFHIIWVGLLMTGGSLGLFLWTLDREGLEFARSLTFYTVAMFQVFHVLAIRVSRESVFTAGFFGNPWLIGAVALTVGLQLAVIYFPPLQVAFQTVGLPLADLLIATLVASSVFFAVEVEKGMRRRGEGYTPLRVEQPREALGG